VTRVRLLRWAAWSPGIETENHWRRWARAPHPLEREGTAEISFLPALQRRRCDALCRAMLHVAHACLDEGTRSEVTLVFASRFGGFGNMVAMLEALAQGQPLSPARFSHSVHNTAAGLFSIWAGNRQASTSLAAGAGTFGFGFLEALGMLERDPKRPVLFVSADEAVPRPMADVADHDHGVHAVALLLGKEGRGDVLDYRLETDLEGTPRLGHPDALEFIRWYLQGEPGLRIGHPPHAWIWLRAEGSVARPSPEDQ